MMAVSSIVVKYVFVKIVKSTYRHQLYLLFNIEESTQSSTHTHSCLTREKKKNSTSTLRCHRWRKKMFSGSSCRKEKNILAAKFPLGTTIIFSWRQDHSLERPTLKHSWLASKSLYICPSSMLRTTTTRRKI